MYTSSQKIKHSETVIAKLISLYLLKSQNIYNKSCLLYMTVNKGSENESFTQVDMLKHVLLIDGLSSVGAQQERC